jgi:hypothetical protein
MVGGGRVEDGAHHELDIDGLRDVLVVALRRARARSSGLAYAVRAMAGVALPLWRSRSRRRR